MSETNLSPTLAVNIPPTLTLTVSHEQFVELALANRGLEFVVGALALIIFKQSGCSGVARLK